MGRGLFPCRKHQRKAQNTHLLQKGLARGMSTRFRQLIEPRGAVKETTNHIHLFTEQAHRVRRRHEPVEEHRLDVVDGVVDGPRVLGPPPSLLKQPRQAQLGLGARQQLLVPEGVAPHTTDGRPRRVAEPVWKSKFTARS